MSRTVKEKSPVVSRALGVSDLRLAGSVKFSGVGKGFLVRLCWGLGSAEWLLLRKIPHSSAMNGAPDLWADLMYRPPACLR